MPYTDHPLAKKDIMLLSLPKSIKTLLVNAVIANLKQLLRIPMPEWEKRIEGLTYRQSRKLIRYLGKHDMALSIKI